MVYDKPIVVPCSVQLDGGYAERTSIITQYTFSRENNMAAVRFYLDGMEGLGYPPPTYRGDTIIIKVGGLRIVTMALTRGHGGEGVTACITNGVTLASIMEAGA